MGGCHWLLLTCLLLLLQVSYEATSSQTSGGKHTKRAIFGWGRGPGFFSMITQFIRETIRDTNRAVRNITDIINAEFPPNSQSQNSSVNSTSVSGARRLTLPEVNDILGRNYRSLVRLFNTEFRSALVDSNRNIQRYRQEIKDAIRPYFVGGAFSTTTTPRPSTNPS
uniref:Secreted protein n=1 Tax=Triatoma infestans TaxID=30076 RepID=A0A170XTJ1_TRIIF